MRRFNLPLFPLNTVLFPGQTLPLHIFEPRYRELVADCLATNRTFGVVLIREGAEVGAPAVPYDVGTTAVIQEVEKLPDGRMNIVTIGRERFRIEGYDTTKSYLVGRVTRWPWEKGALPPERELRHAVERRLERYAALLSEVTDKDVQLSLLPQDPAALAVLATVVLQLPLTQKQALLEIPSVDELLRYLNALLQQENLGLQIMRRAAPQRGEMTHPFSEN